MSLEPRRSTLMLLVWFWSPLLAAQTQFVELGGRHMPQDGRRTTAIRLADVDNDGDLDAVTFATGAGAGVLVYRNGGSGIFGAGTMVASGGTPLLADVDKDGDLDLLAGTRLFGNDGRGNFAPSTLRMPTTPAKAPTFGDVDGDGDLDLVVDTFLAGPLLWINDGRGNFDDRTSGRLPTGRNETSQFAIVDVDGDKDFDLVLANRPYLISERQAMPGPTKLFLNVNGVFQDVTASRIPADPWDSSVGVLAIDVDKDRDVDLVIANQQSRTRLYLNDGKGSFRDFTSTHLPDFSGGTHAVDVDADGDPDLVAGGTLYVNVGAGRFRPAAAGSMPGNLRSVLDTASGDVDGDRDADIVYAWHGRNRLLLNDGKGAFVDGTASRMPWTPGRPMVLGDVDRDGDPDLVLGSQLNVGGTGALLLLNDGNGDFGAPTSGGLPSIGEEVWRPMFLDDIDQDQDLDLLFLASSGQNRFLKLYLNDGRGNFTDGTAMRMPAASRLPRGGFGTFALADVDGDKDVDIVLGVYRAANRLLLNDGRGFFSDASSKLPPVADPTNALVLGDVDADGDRDLFLAGPNWSGRSQTMLWQNDGKGTFTDVTTRRMPLTDNLTNDLALGDVDADRDLDLLVGNLGSSSYKSQRNRLYLNDGKGAFQDAPAGRLPDVISNSQQVAFADIDLDGDLDVFLGTYLGGGRFYLNDGKGSFKDAGTRLTQPSLPTFYFAVSDVDLDGDPDLLNEGKLYSNLFRHGDAPYLARTGRPYVVEFFARPGNAPSGQLVLPFLSDRQVKTSLPPFGVLGLDPVRLFALPLVSIARGTGKGLLPLVIPGTPALGGLGLHVQGFVLPTADPATWRLANVAANVVRNL